VPAEVIFRRAVAADLPAIMALLADDDIARSRGGYDELPEAAFAAIDADPRNELIVAAVASSSSSSSPSSDDGDGDGDGDDGAVVGTCQLTFIPGLSRGGTERMTIEAVRVRSDRRGAGLGRQMMAYALERARARGCTLAQLTTDKRRAEAHRFYESLGFVASHEGMKLAL
jgi:GNAT superfamily N-acetyltransferase